MLNDLLIDNTFFIENIIKRLDDISSIKSINKACYELCKLQSVKTLSNEVLYENTILFDDGVLNIKTLRSGINIQMMKSRKSKTIKKISACYTISYLYERDSLSSIVILNNKNQNIESYSYKNNRLIQAKRKIKDEWDVINV